MLENDFAPRIKFWYQKNKVVSDQSQEMLSTGDQKI
jgi:hypothetical protein